MLPIFVFSVNVQLGIKQKLVTETKCPGRAYLILATYTKKNESSFLIKMNGIL